MKFDPETTAILDAWAGWCRAFRTVSEPNGALTLLLAERNLWAQLVSQPSGAVAAGVFGDAIVSSVDTLRRMGSPDEKSNADGMAASVFVGLAGAGARYILRRLPDVDSTQAMEHVHDLIIGGTK